jgi:hypothetical protein
LGALAVAQIEGNGVNHQGRKKKQDLETKKKGKKLKIKKCQLEWSSAFGGKINKLDNKI